VLGFQKAECCNLILFPGQPSASREKEDAPALYIPSGRASPAL
jgi:hypothetical protein